MQLRLNYAMPRHTSIDPDSLAARVRARRLAMGLTQAQLAERSALRQPDISKIERGLIRETTGIGRLATALACSVRWLELGGPEPTPGQFAAADAMAHDPLVVELLTRFKDLAPGDRRDVLEDVKTRAVRAQEAVREYLLRNAGSLKPEPSPPPRPATPPADDTPAADPS